MEWDVKPDDVHRGKVVYSVAEFRKTC